MINHRPLSRPNHGDPLMLMPPEWVPDRVVLGAVVKRFLDCGVGPQMLEAAPYIGSRLSGGPWSELIGKTWPAADAMVAGFDDMSREQDQFFGVQRVMGRPAEVYLAALLRALCEVIADVRKHVTTLSAEDRAHLVRGAWALFDYALLRPPSEASPEAATGTVPMTVGSAMGRWRRGHRLFFVVTQGIILGLNDFACAVSRGDQTAGDSALWLSTQMAWCAVGALRFTADFPQDMYSRHVRPAMMPPNVRAGFSGSNGRDHQVLVALFRELKPVLAVRVGDDFRTAIRAMLRAHTCVCAHFGGDQKPSLLMQARGHTHAERTAVGVLETIARGRLAALRSNGPGSRAKPPG